MPQDSGTYWKIFNCWTVGKFQSVRRKTQEVKLRDLKMEGYTNIIGSPYDFDDLDIEGRVVDEWKANPEERTSTNLNVPKVFLLFTMKLILYF